MIIAGNPRFESLIKVWGSKTYLSDGPGRWVGEKEKKIVSKGRILPYEKAHFSFFWKFSKMAILIGKYLCENSTYRKNGVHHDEGNGKCKKTVISDF